MKKTFKQYNLDPKLQEALNDAQYSYLTKVQEATLSNLLSEGNYLIQAKTGSGKTAAFCLPLIEKIAFTDPLSALIIVPTRELALQVQHEFNRLGLYKKIHCTALIGKTNFKDQINALKLRNHVIVGTPGRIFDHLEQQTLDLSTVKTLVLDEASELFTLGLQEQVLAIQKQMNNHFTWLFSATLDRELSLINQENYKLIKVDEMEVNTAISTYHHLTTNKQQQLQLILNSFAMESCLIFVNTQEATTQLATFLKPFSLCAVLHGGMPQNKRNLSLKNFKQGKKRILIATDVAARGLDISGLSHIIHYDVPTTYDSYIHRSGRTGRKDDSGFSICLIDPQEINQVAQQIIENSVSLQMPSSKIDNHWLQTINKPNQDQQFTSKNLTIFIRAGKKDKVRNIDLVGALSAYLPFEQIGTINIQATYSTVILLNCEQELLAKLQNLKIKGKKRRIELKK